MEALVKRIRTVCHIADRPRDTLSAGVSIVALVTKSTGASFEPMTFTNDAIMSRFSVLHKNNKVFEFLLASKTVLS